MRKNAWIKKSVLVRVIGATRKEAPVISFIKWNCKPRGAFRITKVNLQSFKVGFYNEADFEQIRTIKWEHMGGELILVRQWRAEESTTEDSGHDAAESINT